MWPALAGRCRQALPASLQWAAPLLDLRHPLPVPCAEAQVRDLFRWLDGLPNTERVSIGLRTAPSAREGSGVRPLSDVCAEIAAERATDGDCENTIELTAVRP